MMTTVTVLPCNFNSCLSWLTVCRLVLVSSSIDSTILAMALSRTRDLTGFPVMVWRQMGQLFFFKSQVCKQYSQKEWAHGKVVELIKRSWQMMHVNSSSICSITVFLVSISTLFVSSCCLRSSSFLDSTICRSSWSVDSILISFASKSSKRAWEAL